MLKDSIWEAHEDPGIVDFPSICLFWWRWQEDDRRVGVPSGSLWLLFARATHSHYPPPPPRCPASSSCTSSACHARTHKQTNRHTLPHPKTLYAIESMVKPNIQHWTQNTLIACKKERSRHTVRNANWGKRTDTALIHPCQWVAGSVGF